LRAVSFRSAAALAPLLLTAACSEPFEEDACPAASCTGEGPSCRSYDFEGSACPSDIKLSGNTSMAGVVGECQGGKLHISAKDTLDIFAQLGLQAPDTDYVMKISSRIAITDWDGGAVLNLRISGDTPFELRAGMTPAGNVRYELCQESSCDGSFEAPPGEEHRFDFEVSSSGTQATVDCKPFASTPALALATSTGIQLTFGKFDAKPVDGTLDDVVVAFR